MARDPYTVLGLNKNASDQDIKSAFRKLAKKWHPDANKNTPSAKEKFNEANQAYEIIGDKTKRRKYDRGEIGPDGVERSPFSGSGGGADPFASTGPFGRSKPNAKAHKGFRNADDFIREMFGNMPEQEFQTQGKPRQSKQAGAASEDTKARLSLSVSDLIKDEKVDVQLPSGKKLAVQVPPGTRDKDTIRLRAQGEMDGFGNKADLLLEIHVLPSRKYQIIGQDVHSSFHVPLATAVTGGKTQLETPLGSISLNIPAWSSSGKIFRLRGKGLPQKNGIRGDLLFSLQIDLPEDKPEALKVLLERLSKH